MNVPTIFDLLDRLAFIRGWPSVAILLLAAFVSICAWGTGVRRFRSRANRISSDGPVPVRTLSLTPIAFPAMLVLYLTVGVQYFDVIDPRLAVVHIIGGFFIGLILLVTGGQLNWGRPPVEMTADDVVRMRAERIRKAGPFILTDRSIVRLGLSAAVLLGVIWLTRATEGPLPIPQEGLPHLDAVILGLAGLGLVGLAASAEPLPSGFGLLIFLAGFSLYYSAIDPSVFMTVVLVGLQLIVALVAGYLAQARYLPENLPD